MEELSNLLEIKQLASNKLSNQTVAPHLETSFPGVNLQTRLCHATENRGLTTLYNQLLA